MSTALRPTWNVVRRLSKPRGLALLLLLLLTSWGRNAAAQDSESDSAEVARTTAMDFRGFGNWMLPELTAPTAPWGGPFAVSNVVAGVAFEVSGALEMAPAAATPAPTRALARARGLPVGRKIAAVHLLHAVLRGADEGAVVAQVVFNLVDNPPVALPVLYGEHVRAAADTNDIILDSNTKPVSSWPSANRPAPVRWFRTTLLNPFPDKEVESLDFFAGDTGTACVILAASVGRALDGPPPSDALLPGFDDINKSVLHFLAIDAASGKPVEGLRVKVGVSEGNVSSSLGSFLTESNGACAIPLPGDTMTFLHMYMIKDGYVQKSQRWYRRSPTDTSTGSGGDGGLTPPTNLVFKAEPAAVLGGLVRDEAGAAVPGVKITVQNFSIISSGNRGEQLSMTGVEAVTDEAGRWRLACLPRNYTQFSLQAEHPEFARTLFVPDSRSGNYAGTKIPMRALLATNAVMTLRRGLGITGVVTDAGGRPVAGARILVGESRYRSSSSASSPVTVRSDAEGQFRLPAQVKGRMTLTTQAAGFAPELTEVEVASLSVPLAVRLTPARLLRGRVVDALGLPVGDVRISVQAWRNKPTLQWNGRSEGDGRFEWDSAPADGVQCYFYKDGYLSQVVELQAGETEHVVRLLERPIIAGRVIDAETRQPVSDFRVTSGRQYGPGSYGWNETRDMSGTDGGFSMPLEDSGPEMVLKITASGYRAFTSKPFNPADGDVALEFALQPGRGLKGVVRLPDGSPAAGAQVAAVSRNSYVQLAQTTFSGSFGPRNEVSRTDATGRFTLSEDEELLMVVATHARGFAEAKPDQVNALTNLVLQPWGRVEGVLRIGAKPGAGQQLILSHGDQQIHQFSYSYQHYQATTDDEGRFKLEFVPPGFRALFRLVPIGENSRMWSHRTEVEVKPSATAQVRIGGTGRPVTGRAVLKSATREIDWSKCQGSIYSVTPRIAVRAGSPTPRPSAPQSFGFACAADGTFRVEDVPAGNYSVNVTVMETEDRGNSRITRSIGFGNKPFTVAPMAGGRSDEAQDVGEIEVRLNAR